MSFENPNDQIQAEKKETIQAENIILLPEGSKISLEEIAEQFGQEQKVIVCDFYIDDIESRGEEESYGLNYHNITNIDHHAPIKAMERPISSATLAIEYVKEFGVQKESAVVVNHTDCDSTLTSSIIRGTLPPEERFSLAAISADHTGEPNEIADLLQALTDKRDLDFSLRNLNLLLEGGEIEEEAKVLLEKRLTDRQRAKELVLSGAFQYIGPVAYSETTEKFDGAFLPDLLPDSQVILLASPFKSKEGEVVPKRLEVKIRLGKNVPEGMTLHSLGLKDTEIHFGGRWNAGSNKRSKGTDLKIEECAQIVAEKILYTRSV